MERMTKVQTLLKYGATITAVMVATVVDEIRDTEIVAWLLRVMRTFSCSQSSKNGGTMTDAVLSLP